MTCQLTELKNPKILGIQLIHQTEFELNKQSSPCNTVLTHNYSDKFSQFEDCELTANVFFDNKNTYFHEFIDGIFKQIKNCRLDL